MATTTEIHHGVEMGATEHLRGDHVQLGGGNHLGTDPVLGAALVKDMTNRTQGRTKGKEVHQQVGSRVA